MHKIKLIALDMDGTALQNDHKSISRKMKKAIESAIEQNIMVVPTSGRICSVLPPAVTSLEGIDYAITSNGSVIYSLKEHTTVYSNYISGTDTLWILNNLPPDILVEIWRYGNIYISSNQFRSLSEYPLYSLHIDVLRKIGIETNDLIRFVEQTPNAIEKINLPYIPPSLKPKLWHLLAGRPEYSLIDTGAGIEIMHTKVSKAHGLFNLCSYFQHAHKQINMENVLAIGDSENDIEMLNASGISVAMGNANEKVKEAAKNVTLSNIEDGAALAIEKYALSR